jgi:myo-inositol 2-dehydrogenase / D-chiro-inositol 1-dehydrogenase
MNTCSSSTPQNDSLSRRDFIKTSAGAAVGGALAGQFAFPAGARADDTRTLKIGLVGCGGRGTGAAGQALSADKNLALTAVADAFSDRIDTSLVELKKKHGDKVQVEPDHQFVGLDAYEKVLASGVDVVLLASPPGFRPIHIKAAVAAGKHIFTEKPMAVDSPGVHKVLEAADEAKRKNLSLVSGFCWRYSNAERETFKRIHEGAIGDVRAVYSTYLTGLLWVKPRKPEWTDMEWQVRDWMYFTWLSGDHIVEQAIHSINKIAWAMRDTPPLRATATGGRQVRVEPEYGHIYDHFAVMYEWENGVRGFLFCRQQPGCANEVNDHIIGSKGYCDINGALGQQVIKTDTEWRYDGPRNDKYQTEHDEFFASIRAGKPLNDGDWMCKSTFMGIMGRMSAYTGQTITWDQVLNSKEDLSPPSYDWKQPLPVPPVAMPGKTKFV